MTVCRKGLVGARSAFLVLVVLLIAVSTAHAQKWSPVGPPGGTVRDLAHDPRNPDRVYLGTADGILYRSDDGGASWARLDPGFPTRGMSLDDIAVDARSTVYVGYREVSGSGGGVARSTDAGHTFTLLPGIQGESVRAIALAPSSRRVIAAGTLTGVFLSRDAGQTWTRITPKDHPDLRNIESLAFDPDDPRVLYAGTWHLAWRTRDGQESGAGIQAGNIVNFRLSPDDRQVALSRVDPLTNTSDIWIADLERAAASTRFTLNPMNDISPVWSPDGGRVAFRSDRTGGNILFGKAFGAGSDEHALSRDDVANPSDWSPDGRYVIFHQAVAINGLDVGMADLQNGGTRTLRRS